jgi:hypothetical protein
MGIFLLIIVPRANAMALLGGIGGVGFRRGLGRYFRINANGIVDSQSLDWLYCWATTGWTKTRVANNVQRVWRQIFGFSVNIFDKTVCRPLAESHRY